MSHDLLRLKTLFSMVQKTLSFIHNEATSVHGNVRSVSIFTTESGEWKLGGFELLTSLKEDNDVYVYNSSHHLAIQTMLH